MNSTNLNCDYKYSEQVMAAEQAGKVGKLYKEVFATPPWNEAFRCTNGGCGQNYGKEFAGAVACPGCGGGMEDYYDVDKLTSEIVETSKLVGFKIASVLRGEDLLGFWYGWDGTLDEINEQKLNLKEPDLQLIKDLSPVKKYFYASELGVSPENRGLGLGKKLFQFGMERVDTPAITRTNIYSPAFTILKKNGFKLIWNYDDGSSRVLLSKNV